MRIERDVARCRACPRLVEYREEVARTRRRAFRDETYWGRAVPGFGDPHARILLVGLAPAAHGANRTGRMFTGDGSDGHGAADFLTHALHGAGMASQATSRHRDDGLVLSDVYLTAICRCAPPANKPLREEIEACAAFLRRELDALEHVRVLVALGKLAFDQVLRLLAERGHEVPRPRPKFGHGALVELPGAPRLLGSYHPSRQNTQTGRLTNIMLTDLLRTAGALASRQ